MLLQGQLAPTAAATLHPTCLSTDGKAAEDVAEAEAKRIVQMLVALPFAERAGGLCPLCSAVSRRRDGTERLRDGSELFRDSLRLGHTLFLLDQARAAHFAHAWRW